MTKVVLGYNLKNDRIICPKLRLPGDILRTSYVQMINSNGRKWKGNKKPLDEDGRGDYKSWLKTQHLKKKKSMASGPNTSW